MEVRGLELISVEVQDRVDGEDNLQLQLRQREPASCSRRPQYLNPTNESPAAQLRQLETNTACSCHLTPSTRKADGSCLCLPASPSPFNCRGVSQLLYAGRRLRLLRLPSCSLSDTVV